MTVVVTGAAGHLGSNLVRALLNKGREVRALVYRDTRGLDGLDLEYAHGDVLDYDSLVAAFRSAQVVYHLAGQVNVAGSCLSHSQTINVIGTRNVVAACLSCGVRRLVHASSSQALCHKPVHWPLDDSRPLADTSCCCTYDRSKAMAERVINQGVECGLDAVIARSSAVLGPLDFKPSQMGAVLLLAAKGWLPASVSGGHDWVDARDVAEGMIAAERGGRCGEGYLLGGHWISISKLFQQVGEETGRSMPKLEVPLWLARAAAPLAEGVANHLGMRPLFSLEAIRMLRRSGRVSSRKAEHELGYLRRPWKVTLRDTVGWYRKVGML